MDATKPHPVTPAPKRRWYQLNSVRFLILFALCCTLAFSWLIVKRQRAERQAVAFGGLKTISDCTFFYDRFGIIRSAIDQREVLFNCEIWGYPWDLDLSTSNAQPTTWEKWAGGLFGEHFVRHIVTVELAPKGIGEAIPLLKKLPHLRTVLVRQTVHNHKPDYSDAVVDAAVMVTKQGVPGVKVETLRIDLDPQIDPGLFKNTRPDPDKNFMPDLMTEVDFQIGDLCWTHDTTEVVASAASWAGLILEFCPL
jgi:hypothetical protein